MQGRRLALIAAALIAIAFIAIGGLTFLVFEQRTANQQILSELDRLRPSIDRQGSAGRELNDQVASLSDHIVALERDNKDLRRQLAVLQRRRPVDVASHAAMPTPLLESSSIPLYAEHAAVQEPATLISTLPITWATDWTSYQPAGIIAPSPQVAVTRKLTDPTFMKTMYAGYGALQVADIATTFSALNRGAGEGNPLVRSSVEKPALFIGIKAATTAATLYTVQKLRKRNPMVASVTLLAINATLAAVVVNNANVSR